MPTIEPRRSSAPRTVSKIGISRWLSAGSPTQTSRPPRASERNACSNGCGRDRRGDRGVGAAEALDRGHGILFERVDEVLGADRPRALEPRRVDVDGDDRGAGDARVLDREMPEPAGAEHGDEVRRARAGVLDRLVGGHAGAGQRRRVGGVDAVRDAYDVPRVAERVLGEAAVERVAHVALLEAERLAAAVAVAAHAAGVAEPRQRDAHAGLEAVHLAGTQALDHADALVAGDERRRRLDRPLAARGVDVGVAEPAGLDAHEHLAGAGLGDGQVLDLQRAIEGADDGGFHGSTSLGR